MQCPKQKNSWQKGITGFVLVLFLFTQILTGVFFYPRKAEALGPVVEFPLEAAIIPQIARQEVAQALRDSFMFSAFSAINDAAQYFVQRMAYDTAVWMASGFHGERPMFLTEERSTYFKDVGVGAAAKSIEALNKSKFLTGLGVQIPICQFPTPELRLAFQVGLWNVLEPPKPACTWKQLRENWDQWTEGMESGELLHNVGVSFEPGESDLSTGLVLYSNLFDTMGVNRKLAEFEALMNKGFKPVTGIISGWTKTPASVAEEKLTKEVVATKPESIEATQARAQMAVGDIHTLGTLMAQAGKNLLANTFLTFLGKGLESLIKGGLVPTEPGSLQTEEAQPGRGIGSKRAAELAFADLKTIRIGEGGTYDPLTEFASCNPSTLTLNSCVLDGQLAQAIREGLTVREAMEKNLLHADWPLISPNDATKNQDPYCYTYGYCYSNLVKLRKARIIPIGWEIAAKNSPQGAPWRLKDVVNGFYDCTLGTSEPNIGKPIPSEENLYCHLIDPNWVLYQPLHQCRAKVPGQILMSSESNLREEVCVDTPSCLFTDKMGNCTGGWGYCVNEKNIWRIDADECPAYYNSCRNLTKRTGGTFSYLTNTLDKGVCNADNVGCQKYSRTPAAGAAWSKEDTDWIYFNKNVEACTADKEGCSELIKLTPNSGTVEDVVKNIREDTDYTKLGQVQKIHLKKAPEYLGCDKAKPIDAQKCQQFATSCKADEVGCESYKPKNTDPSIPGIVQQDDYCHASCVGYQAFRQMDALFEQIKPEEPLDYFIPKTGRSCSAQEAGCEEFTNLDVLARGGEAREYYTYLRLCKKPADDPGATFYTWEGADTTGYQLKKWQLMAVKSNDPEINGSPATTPLDEPPIDCKTQFEEKSDPDCRQFYNKEGKIFYRPYSKTIVISEECTPYRRTMAVKEDECLRLNGAWREITGEEGECIYNGLKTESTACSAQAVGCRGYRGNTGNVVKTVFSEDFKNENKAGWNTTEGSGVSFNPESLFVGDYSLKIEKDKTAIVPVKVATSTAYLISFWAKGKGTIIISLADADANTVDPTTDVTSLTGAHWQYYQAGPLVSSVGGELKLSFKVDAQFYIDNIIFKEIRDTVYVIKNSWNTPTICDWPALHEAVGCQEYTNRKGQLHTLKSFFKLCRQQAVGCEALIDTHNSSSPLAQSFDIGGDKTITVPKDSVIYLVSEQSKQCAPAEKGCQRFGKPEIDARAVVGEEIKGWTDVFWRADPEKYSLETGEGQVILCKAEEVGCEQYNSDAGPFYFKDPSNRTCEYKEKVKVGGVDYSGWFKSGTSQPCYPNYQESGGFYGIYKNLDIGIDKYDRWAGICAPNYNACEEFEDPMDKKDYYYLDNAKMDSAKGGCNGMVSQKEGCALFDQTSQPRKLWDATATYQRSAAENDALVAPVANVKPENNTANLILKVQRDRACSKWLACKTSSTIWDETTGKQKVRCSGLGLCDAYTPTGSGYTCGNFLTEWEGQGKLLTEEQYIRRTVGWSGQEYSGYSIPDTYSIADLKVINFASGNNPEWGLGYEKGAEKKDIHDKKSGEAGFDMTNATCRGYPEKDSPFPNVVKDKVNFRNVNLCEKGNECECRYKNVKYGHGFTKYYPFGGDSPVSFCYGGAMDGKPCPVNGCGTDSTCQYRTGVTEFIGWEGHCLEKDLSRNINADSSKNPCITWRPVDIFAGGLDIGNYFASAGFLPVPGQEYYCGDDFSIRTLTVSANGEIAATDFFGSPKLGIEGQENFGCPVRREGNESEWLKCNLLEEKDYFGQYKKYNQTGGDDIRGDIQSKRVNCGWTKTAGVICNWPSKSGQQGNETNFVGFYEISKSRSYYSLIQYPIKKFPIYKWQLDNIVVQFANPNKEIAERFTGETVHWVIPEAMICNIKIGTDAYCESKGGVSNWVQVWPIWGDSTLGDQLQALRIRAASSGDSNDDAEGFFDIESIRFDFVPGCQTIYQVHQDGLYGGENKAWTDIVWADGQFEGVIGDPEKPHARKETECKPWGAINQFNPQSFNTFVIDGLNSPDVCDAKMLEGVAYSWDEDYDIRELAQMFAHQYGGWQYNEIAGNYRKSENLFWNKDYSKEDRYIDWAKEKWKPKNFLSSILPQIAAPDLDKCSIRVPTQCAVLEKNNFTINGRASGDLVGQAGQLLANVQFYGWADTNRMPLRDVKIDWKDGEQISNPGGKYKNHKPYCSTEDKPAAMCNGKYTATQLTCDVSNAGLPTDYCNNPDVGRGECQGVIKTFGNSPGACQEGYFEFEHSYVCNKKGDPGWRETCPLSTIRGGCCFFKPTVTLKDNWEKEKSYSFGGQIIVLPQ